MTPRPSSEGTFELRLIGGSRLLDVGCGTGEDTVAVPLNTRYRWPALSEAARVLRPGGRLAAFEPDWTSLAITGANPGVTRRMLAARSMAFASPDVGARLPHLVAEAGFGDVRRQRVHLETTALHVAVRAFRLEAHVEAAVASGAVSPEEAIAWFETLAAADRLAAFCSPGRWSPGLCDEAGGLITGRESGRIVDTCWSTTSASPRSPR